MDNFSSLIFFKKNKFNFNEGKNDFLSNPQIESSKGRGYKWNHLIEKIQIIVFKKGSIT